MLRVGIILTVTGVIAIAHWFSGSKGVMPRSAELATAIGLIVVGTPLLVIAISRR